MADCQAFNTDEIISIMRKDGIDYSTYDSITWHKTTKKELEQFELRRKEREEQEKKALEIKLPLEIKVHLEETVQLIEQDVTKYESILDALKKISQEYPYRKFGIHLLEEAIGYLGDTKSTLKERIEEV